MGLNADMYQSAFQPMHLIALVVLLVVVIGAIAGVTLLVRAVWRSGTNREPRA
jgi:uncharacterized membrane protein